MWYGEVADTHVVQFYGAMARSCEHGNKSSGPQNTRSSLITSSTTSGMVSLSAGGFSAC
jgi:hypothetical protein